MPHRRLPFVLLACIAAGCASEETDRVPRASSLRAAMDTVPTPVARLGDSETFGTIDGIAVLPGGDIVVTDGINGRLLMLSEGRVVHEYGGLGEGPDEFGGLGRVAVVSADTLVVRDTGRRELVALLADASGIRRLHTLALPFRVTRFCATDGRLFVRATQEDRLVHEVTLSGEVVASFAEEFGSDPLDVMFNGATELACGDRSGRVALVARSLGTVRIFGRDGALALHDTIPGFSPAEYEGDMYQVTPKRPEIGYSHLVRNLHWLGPELLVQLHKLGPGVDSLESRWWSEEGGWAELAEPWPTVLATDAEGRIYAAVETPYPLVHVYGPPVAR